jgi:hypothetical protein
MGRTFLATVVGAALILFGLAPGRASAQPPTVNFDQLPSRVRVGDDVWVKGNDGVEVKGKLWELSPTSLKVMTDGQAKELSAQDVRTVSTRKHDSLANGAWIGLAVGAALGIVGAALACEGDDCVAEGAIVGLIYGGIGAGIGVGVDAMIPGGKMQVYNKGAGAPSARLSVRPVLSPRQQGVVVRVGF